MKAQLGIHKTTRNYPKGNAKKEYYGWDGQKSSSTSSKIDISSAKEYLLKLLEKAEQQGYHLEDFDLEFHKVIDKNTRKEVEFRIGVEHTY
ncbi:MAG: hypothetical protein J6Y02_02610 [Pseudobutyrivibrio sp.]|nr:hypothetical protein [Pseudobutyrivibrio sp.]